MCRPAASALPRRAGAGITRRLTSVLPPAGPLRRYAVISLVDSTGTGLFLAAGTLFFTRVAGLPAGLVGLGLSFAGLAAMLAAIPLGSLGDKLGHRNLWVILTALQALTYACYPLVHSFLAFVAAVTVAAASQAGTAPIRGAYLSRAAGPDQRVRASAYNQAVFNAGFAVGAAGAGVALEIGSRDAFVLLVLADAASYAISAALILTMPVDDSGRPASAEPADAGRKHGVRRDVRFLVVSGLNGLLMTYAAILTVALPLWIVTRTAAPRWTVAALLLLNTLLATTLQVRASRTANTLTGATRAIRRAGGLLLMACVIFALSHSLPAASAIAALAVGCALLTLGEVLHSAGAWGISYGLAPADKQGQYLGAFAMGTRLYDTIGPVVVVGLVIGIGTAGWVLLGASLLGISMALTPAACTARRHASHARSAADLPDRP